MIDFSAWNYRRKIKITNSGDLLQNYQLRLTLDSSNFDFTKANSDGSDIRFTTPQHDIRLPYWIETWDGTNQKATVWVKVLNIPSGDSYIYMYYGNSSATSEANGDDVFLFFDDFNGTTINELKWFHDASNISIDSGRLKITDSGHVQSKLYIEGENLEIIYNQTGSVSSGQNLGTGVFNVSLSNNQQGFWNFLNGTTIHAFQRSGTSWVDLFSGGSVDTNYNEMIIRKEGNTYTSILNGTVIGSATVATGNRIFIGAARPWEEGSDTGTTYYDNLRICRYTATLSTLLQTEESKQTVTGTVTDKEGNQLTTACNIIIADKDCGAIKASGTTDNTGNFSIDAFTYSGEKYLVIAFYQGNYNGDTDVAAAWYQTTS